jgi:hypothetical protein
MIYRVFYVEFVSSLECYWIGYPFQAGCICFPASESIAEKIPESQLPPTLHGR